VTARRTGGALALIVALGLSGLAVATAPDNDDTVGPVVSTAPSGETATTRQFSARVDEVSLAQEIDVSYGANSFSFLTEQLPTEGVWVVVDVTITNTYGPILLHYSQLRIGGVEYRTTSLLPTPTVVSHRFGPGIPVRGPLVFEVPASVLESDAAAHAVLDIRATLTPQLDGVTVHDLDLSGLTVDDSVVLGGATVEEGF